MESQVSYRKATMDDVLDICKLGQLLNAIHHEARPDIYSAATTDYARDLPHLMRSFESPSHVVYIAHVDNRAAGFITASLASSSGPLMQPLDLVRIGSVCVAEAEWGKGIGRCLLQMAKDWAIQQGAKDIRLTVWAFNAQAIRLYTELGYETRALEMGMRL